ncbi:MAG: hypothetical protein KME20_27515 [Kaiparowitsia implicata GSE-PSE-MK54-09C]|jgi:hypothetical protein|nr:hypothetical protein [Kaiparowitsia implicata GSE-PSE-MK54-09C]
MPNLDKVLQQVGQLNYVWTNTESLFIYLIAHLAGTSKDAAVIIFLTLNTTRARLELLDRLAKLPETPPETRAAVLDLTDRLKKEAKVRNKYNHCIYSFDSNGELSGTQLMRIVDFGDELKYGKSEALDETEFERVQTAIASITAVNKDMWAFFAASNIRT